MRKFYISCAEFPLSNIALTRLHREHPVLFRNFQFSIFSSAAEHWSDSICVRTLLPSALVACPTSVSMVLQFGPLHRGHSIQYHRRFRWASTTFIADRTWSSASTVDDYSPLFRSNAMVQFSAYINVCSLCVLFYSNNGEIS